MAKRDSKAPAAEGSTDNINGLKPRTKARVQPAVVDGHPPQQPKPVVSNPPNVEDVQKQIEEAIARLTVT